MFFNFQGTARHLIDLYKLIVTLFSFAHMFSILWHGIAVIQINVLNSNNTWLHQTQLIEEDNLFKRYISCFYFSTVTITSVGYGDIYGTNFIERAFLIFMLLSSGVAYAFTINSIGAIMENIKRQRKRMNEEKDAIDEYMTANHVPADLRNRILNHITYMYQ